ncbi:hypothetical protein M0Q28_02415 [Patescibacteria group bacterium]|jgi:hypothetical protein|nr:hypothetical protein [Patescibacteria group bacterium]
MPWQILVLFRVLAAHIGFPYAVKKLSGLPGRSRRIALQFAYCILFTLGFAVLSGDALVFDWRFAAIFAFGIVNALAVYSQWRAIEISMVKNSLFTQADDLIAIGLGMLFLGEAHQLAMPAVATAILLCVFGTVAYTFSTRKKDEKVGSKIFLFIAVYSAVWGVAVFSQRALAIEGMSLSSYALAWYSGTLLGSFGLVATFGRKEESLAFSWSVLWKVGALALLVWTAFTFGFHTYREAPVSISQPIFQVTELVLPLLIGVLIFKEIPMPRWRDRALLAVAVCGATVMLGLYRVVLL